MKGASTASTGISELDRALGGLYWGDNVVLDAESTKWVEPFYRAATEATLYDKTTFVTLSKDPAEVEERYFREPPSSTRARARTSPGHALCWTRSRSGAPSRAATSCSSTRWRP